MKINLKSKRGFNLMELMVGVAISSGVILIGYSTLRTSNQATNIKKVDYETNFIRNQIIAKLSDPRGCENSLLGQPANAAAGVITDLKDKNGAVFLHAGNSYGEKNSIQIKNFTTARTGESIGLTINYDIRSTFDIPGVKNNKSFKIDLYGKFSDATASATISSCSLDVTGLIKKAVQLSCTGNDAFYDPAVGQYGTCTHRIIVLDSAGTTRAWSGNSVATCPTNEYLAQVTTPALVSSTTADGIVSQSGGAMTFQCKKFISTPKCQNWSYLKGFNTDGTPICVSLNDATVYNTAAAGSEFLLSSGTGGNYSKIQISNMICGAGRVLRKFDPSVAISAANPVCAPQVINQNCPAGKYIQNVLADGTPQCSDLTTIAKTCTTAGYYVKSISATPGLYADVTCLPLTIPANCTAPTSLMTGADTAGVATCAAPYTIYAP
jgi:prepilin-type N-terminal cleavage/methylation domain-containing protein